MYDFKQTTIFMVHLQYSSRLGWKSEISVFLRYFIPSSVQPIFGISFNRSIREPCYRFNNGPVYFQVAHKHHYNFSKAGSRLLVHVRTLSLGYVSAAVM